MVAVAEADLTSSWSMPGCEVRENALGGVFQSAFKAVTSMAITSAPKIGAPQDDLSTE